MSFVQVNEKGILMLHRIGHDLIRLKEDGCQLADPPELFSALTVATAGDPCQTGCAYFQDGKCPAYLMHHSVPEEKRRKAAADLAKSHTDQSGLVGGKWRGLSIKQIAAQEGITLSEARRRKQAGAYKE